MMKIRYFPRTDYVNVYRKMSSHVLNKNIFFEGEIWCVEHNPVFTQGMYGKKEYILNTRGIPVVQTDRGGQVTYHGPGQAIIYFILNLKTLNIGIKDLVHIIERSTIILLKHYKVDSHLIDKSPGIYVENRKIASLGLRVKNYITYHGIAINTKMDLKPFSYIHPCGCKDMEITQIYDFYLEISLKSVFKKYISLFHRMLRARQYKTNKYP